MAKTVLIVEDNELNMKLFRDLFEAHGYQTSRTSNGFEALDLVRKLRPDLILMDIQLPQVSGLEVTQVDQGRSRTALHSGRRGHRLCHEGRRRAYPRGRMRGLYLQADLGRQVSSRPFGALSVRKSRLPCPRVSWSSMIYPPTSSCWRPGCRPNISTCSTASNGAEALAICARAECDIVLLDVMMPDMDGFEVCRRLKAESGDPSHSGRDGHRARQPRRPRARPGSRRRRFPDQAGRRRRAARAGALADAPEDDDRRAAHARHHLARDRHARRPSAARWPTPARAAASCSSTTAPRPTSGWRRCCAPSTPSMSSPTRRGAVSRRRGQLRPADRLARPRQFRRLAAVPPGAFAGAHAPGADPGDRRRRRQCAAAARPRDRRQRLSAASGRQERAARARAHPDPPQAATPTICATTCRSRSRWRSPTR